jgi:arsenate reductase
VYARLTAAGSGLVLAGVAVVIRSDAMEIWVNPKCSKCRSAVSMLDEAGAEYTVRRYLDDPPTAGELTAVLDRLGLEPWDIARTGEAVAKELGLGSWERTPASRTRWIAALAENPILIQRPIITADDGTTVVGRTEDAVRSVLPAD